MGELTPMEGYIRRGDNSNPGIRFETEDYDGTHTRRSTIEVDYPDVEAATEAVAKLAASLHAIHSR